MLRSIAQRWDDVRLSVPGQRVTPVREAAGDCMIDVLKCTPCLIANYELGVGWGGREGDVGGEVGGG
jgi:hypothetical protein